MKKQQKSIGILGGMGPDASLKLYQIMIAKSRSDFNATNNDDYPNIILHSIPVPDFISNKESALEALEMLKESTSHISEKSMVMGIACNTVHLFIKELQEVSKAPFISMIEEIGKKAVQSNYKRIGLLATPTTFNSHLYQNVFEKLDIEVVTPDLEQIEDLGRIVCKIVGGEFQNTSYEVKKIADSLTEKSIDAIVLGCTELPLVFPEEYKIKSISSLEVLADTLLKEYYR